MVIFQKQYIFQNSKKKGKFFRKMKQILKKKTEKAEKPKIKKIESKEVSKQLKKHFKLN